MQAKSRHIFSICLMLIFTLISTVGMSACLDNIPVITETKYTLTYERGADDATGTIPTAQSYTKGTYITLEPETTFEREGYSFLGWEYEGSIYMAKAQFKMPAHDVIFTAYWEKDKETPPAGDTSATVTSTDVKFENGSLVLKGTAGEGVKSLVAYLYDTNEKIDSYKSTATIGSDRAFTVRIGLAQLTSAPGNWYYLMISVNGGAMAKVKYQNYNKDQAYSYAGRTYRWEYSDGIAVRYENNESVKKSFDIDMSGTAVRAEKDGRVYLSVSGTFKGYSTDDFEMDIQLQAGEYTRYKKPVTVTFNGDTFKVKMDISEAAANTDGEYYSIHLFVDGASNDVAAKQNPYIIETSATDDNKIYKLKSDKAWWDNSTYIMKVTIEGRSGQLGAQDYLKVDGKDVKNGRGETVMLRGTNAGGYLVSEQWMTAVNYKDYKTASEIMSNRFGEETMQELWAYYRSYYWTDQDFKNCADMGMTAIRLPFSYMNVDFNGEYDFSVLDDFVRGAAKYGIYTILDLHGAYGSQNGQDHSGEVIDFAQDVDFYRNSEKKSKTVNLWKALAEHYKDNPAVAAFDLLNEPGEKGGWTTNYHWDFFDEMYDAIRTVDRDRILIFESCWTGDSLPHPSVYGWENCMYSFHHYVGETDSSGHIYTLDELKQNMLERMLDLDNKNFGVPVYMGEFTCYGNADFWEYTLNVFEEYGWHWTNWAYKTNWSMGGWGIYYTSANSPDLSTDSIYDIKNKWRGTNVTWSSETTLAGKKLKDIIKSALSA